MSPLWLLAGPAAAFVVGLLVGARSRRVVAVVGVAGVAVALGFAAALVAQQPWQTPLVDDGLVGPWAVMPFATLVDGLSVTVVTMVCLVALLVQVFSYRYMADDLRYGTYTAFISLFTAAMLAVLVAGDLLLLVVGWEVMGLCSYVLIGQHWERSESRSAAVKAFLVTKVGDVGFILGVIVLSTTAGSFLVTDVVSFGAGGDETLTSVGTLLLLVGVLGKSAQFPLHDWLPDAMAGPSPVSALIHAATMVAAGVFVVLRLFPLFAESGPTMAVLPVLACVTMVGAAVAALAQQDLKRVLAWSTVSQLALMLGAVSVHGTTAATFHLVIHGFFKALLFLAAGSVIHAAGTSELSGLGGIRRRMPVTTTTFGLGLLALAGIPLMSGFFSKESILVAAEQAALGESAAAPWAGWLVLVSALVTAGLTAAYATRAWLLACCGQARPAAVGEPRQELHESPWAMTLPLLLLAVPTVLLGFTGLRAGWFPTWSLPDGTEMSVPEALRPETVTTVASLALIVVGAAVVTLRWRAERVDPVHAAAAWAKAARAGFGVAVAYDRAVVRPFLGGVAGVERFDRSVVTRAVDEVGTGAQGLGSLVVRSTPRSAQQGLSALATTVVLVVVVVAVAVAVRTTT